MTLPTYPINDYDRGNQLLQQLGSFWANIFNGSDKLQTYLRASGLNNGQTYLNFVETFAMTSRFTVPVFHTENWYLLTVTQSSVAGTPSIYQPDDLVYGPQTGDIVDRPTGFIQTYAGQDRPGIVEIKLPNGLVNIPFQMQNTVVMPTCILTNGIDFTVNKDRNTLTFANNPFNNPTFAQRSIFDNSGKQVDTEISMWVYRGQFDLNYIYNQFGYILNLNLPSSLIYKGLFNAFWDLHLLGPSVYQMQLLLSFIAGVPTIINTTETVQVVTADNASQLVITDSNVYRVSNNATVTVSVGDVLHAGDSICDAIKIIEFIGSNPDYSSLDEITLYSNLISGSYSGGLTFKNHNVSLDYVGLNSNGKAVVKFEVIGATSDVNAFWTNSQTAGEASGQKTLAELLDVRTNPIGQPGPASLPATINPMTFVLSNFLKNNLFVVKINVNSFGAGAPGLGFFDLLREVLPPNIIFLKFVEELSSSSSSEEI